MAARTSAPVGLIVATTLTTLLALVFLALAGVFGLKLRQANQSLAAAQQSVENYVQRDPARADALVAATGAGEGVIDMLLDQRSQLARVITGNASDANSLDRPGNNADNPSSLDAKINAVRGGEDVSLIDLLSSAQARIQKLEGDLELSDQVREGLQSQLAAANTVAGEKEAEFQARVDDLNSRIAEYASAISARSAESVQQADEYRDRISDTRSLLQTEVNECQSEVLSLQSENAQLAERLEILQNQNTGTSLRPADEDALADGRLIGVDTTQETVFVNRGRGDKMVLGMTFEVFGPNDSLERENDGSYPSGKATIEITRIDAESSQARVIRRSRGAPLLENDVIINAVYDPDKTYRFVVFGNFDTTGDNVYTRAESGEIEAIIREWGGEIVDELRGDVDFLILGRKPPVRPQPAPDAPIELFEAFLSERGEAQRYEQLLEQATARSLPVLNENRLYTLTGLRVRD